MALLIDILVIHNSSNG